MSRGISHHLDKARFIKLWNKGVSHMKMGAVFGCSDNTILRRARLWDLPPRVRRSYAYYPVDAAPAAPAPPVQHIAAVRMPSERLEDRADWPDLKAAVERAKAGPAPVTSLGMVAARFRLPTAVVQGLAQKMQEERVG